MALLYLFILVVIDLEIDSTWSLESSCRVDISIIQLFDICTLNLKSTEAKI